MLYRPGPALGPCTCWCSGSLSLCDSNLRTHRRRMWLKATVRRECLSPIPPVAILPPTVFPQQVDLLVSTMGFQAVDRFITRDVLAPPGRPGPGAAPHSRWDDTVSRPPAAVPGRGRVDWRGSAA